MKKELWIKRFRLLMMVGTLLIGSFAHAVVNWHGGAIAGDVTDQDIDVQGVNTISGPITVTATTTDVAVTISTDSQIRGIANDPRFFLVANVGRKIVFNVDNNLLFSGDDSATLLVVVEGVGEVEFILADGKKVSFTADASDHGGTRLFVRSLAGPPDGSAKVPSTLKFRRLTGSAHSEVIVGPKSIMGYLSESSLSFSVSGYIEFDTANTGPGRMVLRIEDEGAVYIAGVRDTAGALPSLLLSDIDMTTISGGARFSTSNSVGPSANASLLVINKNTRFPDLRANPWQEAAPFSGQVWGFVLIDLLTIGENSYIDYVGLTNNFCPNPTIPDNVLEGRAVSQVVKPRNASAFIVDFGTEERRWPSITLEEASALVFRSGVGRDGTVVEKVVPRNGDDAPFSFVVDPLNRSLGEGNIVFDVETPLGVGGGA